MDGGNTPVFKMLKYAYYGILTTGVYALTRPIPENEPSYITQEYPLIQRPLQRFLYRVGSAYKKMVDPDVDVLLPPPHPPTSPYYRPMTLVLELEKLLVAKHWSKERGWTVAKRPWADYFLAYLSQFYELVIFTDEQAFYAESVIKKLDEGMGAVMYQLYRQHTVYDVRNHDQVKDLSMLNRPLNKVLMIDVDPRHFQSTQPENTLLVPQWEGDPKDTYLFDMLPFLEAVATSNVDDVRHVVELYKGKDIPKAYAANYAKIKQQQMEEYQRKQNEQSFPNVQPGSQGKSRTSEWMQWAQDGLGYFFGFKKIQAPVTTAEQDITQQVMNYQGFKEYVDQVRKQFEEAAKEEQEIHQRMTEKSKDLRVTLWEVMTKGLDEAIREKADPEVVAYMDMMNARAMEVQGQQPQ